MLRVALTGGIASGKTTVADRWAEHGAVLIDGDVLARQVVAPGTPGLAAVLARFGDGVRAGDGSLDRPALAELVFADPAARRDLEAILHPLIRARGAELEAAAPADSVVVHVIPLLVESAADQGGRIQDFDVVVVVDLPEELQLERAMARDGASREQVRRRLAAQAGRTERRAVADLSIDNSSDRATLITAADRVWSELLDKAAVTKS